MGVRAIGIYTAYKCRRCNKEVILITDEVQTTLKADKYLACSHCGCKKLAKEKVTDDLREVTKARSYKRFNRRIREIL